MFWYHTGSASALQINFQRTSGLHRTSALPIDFETSAELRSNFRRSIVRRFPLSRNQSREESSIARIPFRTWTEEHTPLFEPLQKSLQKSNTNNSRISRWKNWSSMPADASHKHPIQRCAKTAWIRISIYQRERRRCQNGENSSTKKIKRRAQSNIEYMSTVSRPFNDHPDRPWISLSYWLCRFSNESDYITFFRNSDDCSNNLTTSSVFLVEL